MEILKVLAAAVGCFAAGAVWYISLSKPWIRAVGIPTDEAGKPQGGGSPMPFVISFVAAVLMSGLLRHVFAQTGIDTAGAGLTAGLGVGLFILAPWVAMNYAYAMRPRMLTLIDGGYAILGPAVVGLILGLMG